MQNSVDLVVIDMHVYVIKGLCLGSDMETFDKLCSSQYFTLSNLNNHVVHS